MARSMNGLNDIEVNEITFEDGSTLTSTGEVAFLNKNNNYTALNSYSILPFKTGTGTDLNPINAGDMATKHFVEDNAVLKTGDQTIGGVKTFSSFPVKSGTTLTDLTPTADGQLTPKKYLDERVFQIDAIIDEIRDNVYDDATITTLNNVNTLILSRPDGGGSGDTSLILPQTSLSTCVLKTGTQTIDDVKTFSSFPVKSGTETPTADGQFATKKYVDDNETSLSTCVLLTGDQSIDDEKTFTSFPVKSGTGTPTADGQFATKKYVDDTAGAVPIGDALLNGANTFTSTNTFNNYRPSSTLGTPVSPPNPTPPAPTDFITREDGNALYLPLTNSGVAFLSAPNVFNTGGLTANSFNPRPTTTLTNAITSDMFITKSDAENRLGDITTNGDITTDGKIGVGLGGITPTCALDVEGVIKLRKGTAFIYVDDFQQTYQNAKVAISGNGTSYFALGNGGHHIDTYTTSNNAGRRMYINWYANEQVTLRKTSYASDDRLKVDEKFIENATATLMKLRPQTYMKYPEVRDISMIRPNFDVSGSFESGLIAQEIYYDAPELRHLVDITDLSDNTIIPSSDDPQKDPDYSDWGDMPSSVDYTGLIAYLIKSNQELHERILKLENK